MSAQIYISITGLELKSLWQFPRFWMHAFRAMAQARKAPGNLSASARNMGGVQHTLTTWNSRADMLAFVHSGNHAAAISIFPQIATGKTYGYMSNAAPAWTDIPKIWREKGREYGPD